jgi:hypothetical protein
MKLLDRVALGRTLKMLLDFLYDIIKLWSPSPKGDDKPKPKLRWRKRNE